MHNKQYIIMIKKEKRLISFYGVESVLSVTNQSRIAQKMVCQAQRSPFLYGKNTMSVWTRI
ncbi:MAG: hypothetical protein EA390_03755 [Balneolaceae bacterium]|nr:MAG: hypothetical protein EA390_03755 [Balneolaceae bacterium]